MGAARFAELTPLQRVVGVLVLAGIISLLGRLIVEGALAATHLLRPLVGR